VFNLFHAVLPYVMFIIIMLGFVWVCYLGMLSDYERRKVKKIVKKILKKIGDSFGKSDSKGKHS